MLTSAPLHRQSIKGTAVKVTPKMALAVCFGSGTASSACNQSMQIYSRTWQNPKKEMAWVRTTAMIATRCRVRSVSAYMIANYVVGRRAVNATT